MKGFWVNFITISMKLLSLVASFMFSQLCFLLSLVATLRSLRIFSVSLWASTYDELNPTPSSLWLNFWHCCSNTLFIRYSPVTLFFLCLFSVLLSCMAGLACFPRWSWYLKLAHKKAVNLSYWYFPSSAEDLEMAWCALGFSWRQGSYVVTLQEQLVWCLTLLLLSFFC